MTDFRDALLGASGGEEPAEAEAPRGPRPPDNGWLLIIAWRDRIVETELGGRQHAQTAVGAMAYDTERPNVLTFWDEDGCEHGIPWYRIASYESVPSPERKVSPEDLMDAVNRGTIGAGIRVDIEDHRPDLGDGEGASA